MLLLMLVLLLLQVPAPWSAGGIPCGQCRPYNTAHCTATTINSASTQQQQQQQQQ
jgi:hypothetical protein